jgi:zinc D-Ala-D-Ala carboxypeptidase
MKLSEHFTLDEFTASQTAGRKGINNTPPPNVIKNLQVLAGLLEEVRTLLCNNSIRISSGYRCLALNRAIGSRDNSSHVEGYAVDFTCSGFGTPKQIANKIVESQINFSQLIWEGTWIHLSSDSAHKKKREVLTATFVNGKARYKKGIT